MNVYDHEDAFKSANRCAGRLTAMPDALKMADTQEQARLILLDLQDRYAKLFDAFIEGVEYGRSHPKGTGTDSQGRKDG